MRLCNDVVGQEVGSLADPQMSEHCRRSDEQSKSKSGILVALG